MKLRLLPLRKRRLYVFKKSSLRTTENTISEEENYIKRIILICTFSLGWLIHEKYDEKYMEFAWAFMNMAL
jgi:hypothetical protein